MSLLKILSILQQYLLYVSTFPHQNDPNLCQPTNTRLFFGQFDTQITIITNHHSVQTFSATDVPLIALSSDY